MSRVVSDHLFLLIKSLTGSEKRYFKLFISGADKNPTYVQLFDAIDSQKVYTEQKILKKVKSVKPAQLSNLKNYLYNMILDSLRNYHAEKGINLRLRALLDKIEILYDKRLPEQCLKQIEKAKSIASKYELDNQLIEVLTWERKIVDMNVHPKNTMQSALPLFDQMTKAMEKQMNTTRYARIFRLAVETFRQEGILRNEKSNAEVKKIMRHDLLKHGKKLISYHDYYYYYSIHSIYQILKGNWKLQYQYQKKLLDLMDTHPEQVEYSPNVYLGCQNTHIISCQYTGNYNEMISTFEKVRLLFHKRYLSWEANLLIQFLGCYNSMMHFYTQNGEFEKGLILFREIEPAFKKLKSNMSKSIEFSVSYTMAYTYFGVKKYTSCLPWLNNILNEPSANVIREDLQSFARILNLIVHYELGNKNLLEYLVISTYRFLYRRERLHVVEALVLDFIRKSSGIKTNEDMIRLFAIFRKELLKINKNSYDQKALSYFNFVAWLESKIENKDFAEVVKRNYGKKELV